MSGIDELRRQLEAALESIRELDGDLATGRLSATDHAALKAWSERQAAALLRRVREAEARATGLRPRGKEPAGTGRRASGRALGLTLGAFGLVVVGLTAGVILGRTFVDGRGRTAERPLAPSEAGGEASAALERVRKEVESDAAPTPKLLAFAHLALDEGQVPAALWAYKRVLEREPKNVEAITHLGVILYRGQHVDQALARVDEAIALDPRYLHARWDRANILLYGKKDYEAAERAIKDFLALVPTGEDADRARAMLAEARERGRARGAAR